jgi:hypothetical protein
LVSVSVSGGFFFPVFGSHRQESKKQYEKLKEEHDTVKKQNAALAIDLNAQLKEINTHKAEMEKRGSEDVLCFSIYFFLDLA